jgi:hypothetical protein
MARRGQVALAAAMYMQDQGIDVRAIERTPVDDSPPVPGIAIVDYRLALGTHTDDAMQVMDGLIFVELVDRTGRNTIRLHLPI